MRKIWIWNHYSTDTYFEGAGRHYWFSRNLIKKGYDPTIFCANVRHNTEDVINLKGKLFSTDTKEKIPFVFVKTNEYKGNGISRILNMITFYINLFPVSEKYSKEHGKPDLIFASSVHPLTLIAGIKTAKKMGVPCICEVRDLWPESIVAYSSLKRNSVIAKLLYQGEKWIYKNAEKLVFTMEGGKDYIFEKRWDKEHGGPIDIKKIYHINNGVDLDDFNQNTTEYKLPDVDLDNKDIFKVVYTGSIRLVNKVELLVDVAKLLVDLKVKFLIWGDGDQVETIKRRISNEGLSNIVLKGKVEKNYIPSILERADLNIILGENNELFRYGLSPNKLFEYLAAGKPIIQTFKANYSIVSDNNVGIELSDNSPKKIAESIRILTQLSNSEYSYYCENAISLSKEYCYENLTNKLIDIINE